MNSNKLQNWHRIVENGIPVYIQPEIPDWFLPNAMADQLLQNLEQSRTFSEPVKGILARLNNQVQPHINDRSEKLKLEGLRECWFHVTNRCNMSCSHCMFGSISKSCDDLTVEETVRLVKQAHTLGCRIFYFTGGEPLLSESFFEGAKAALQMPESHVIVLTNAVLFHQKIEKFRDMPCDRLHFQISIDGMENNHNELRGRSAFSRLVENMEYIKQARFPITLSMTVTNKNVKEMKDVVTFAADRGIKNVHYLWLFKKGNAGDDLFVPPSEIFDCLSEAWDIARSSGVKIDNIEMLRSQILSCTGTRYDLSNAGWQSLAVGPDRFIYPTPALIYTDSYKCGKIDDGLEYVYKKSDVLHRLRSASLNSNTGYCENPFRYILGGGDIDHSIIHTGSPVGGDPYIELYNKIITRIIIEEATIYTGNTHPAILLKMGEKLADCPVESGELFFTHSNCVLTLPDSDTHTLVNRYYSQAAEDTKEDIVNPVCYDEHLIAHIPEEMRFRGYGCGSPVIDADLKSGDSHVDLGSGTGIECFISANIVGDSGCVTGIDMSDAMLDVAERSRIAVSNNLGYNNIFFKKSFLEELPLPDQSADIVTSNCVINLSPDKRKVFHEIYRILKPGGRLVVSDITYDEDIPLDIKYSEQMRGECIGGALRYADLFGLLNDTGFTECRIVKGYKYRMIREHQFYSVTYIAYKPLNGNSLVYYDYPDFENLMSEVETEPSCACFVAPQKNETVKIQVPKVHKSGCMACGSELEYFTSTRMMQCSFCGVEKPANAQCVRGHFVCDQCHGADAIEIVRQVCLGTKEKDAAAIMQTIRNHPNFRIHGPEHHAMVPAVTLSALRNNGCDITEKQIMTAIERGEAVPGGACAFLGICGAAIGAGIVFSILLEATPYDGDKRQTVQNVTQKILASIASLKAPRCCQRDCLIAINQLKFQLKKILNKDLVVAENITCTQYRDNKECIYNDCPFWRIEP